MSNGNDSTISYKQSSSFDHIEHIRKNSKIRSIDGVLNKPQFFIDYVIENELRNKEDVKYLTDRRLLKPIGITRCDSSYVLIKDIDLNGDICAIELFSSKFVAEDHEIKFRKSSSKNRDYESIDGKFPYGGIYGDVDRELNKITIKINDRKESINIENLPSINNPMFCESSMLKNGIEAYQHGDNVYVYISGGHAANTYFGKLVFNQNGFVTSIMVDYVPLSRYGSFSDDFIGF